MLRRTILGVIIVASVGCAGEAQPAPAADVEARIARIEASLPPNFTIRGETPALVSLEDRMRVLNVPGVSVAVVNDGRIEWARAWGVADAASGRPVGPNTLFQAASISKPVAALAALRLVQDGRIDLDGDVNQWLSSWNVPENEFTTGAKVTLRGLLTHRAGLSVSGFPGYAAGETVPSAVAILDGQGNTEAVRVFQAPGTSARYSGGGYTVMQVLVSDVEGRPFHEVMRTEVLEPIGMSRSTFEQPIPEAMRDDIALAHDGDGTPIDGDWHTYPEQAAAGLWTTPSDLARYAMEVQRAARGESDRILSQAMTREMLTSNEDNQGLGPAIDTSGPMFRHGGSNAGFRANFAAYIDEGRGAFVMTNAENGGPLAAQILSAIAMEYGWPAPLPAERIPVVLDVAALERWTGDYAAEGRPLVVQMRVLNDTLRAHVPGDSVTFIPMSESTFFDRRTGSVMEFTAHDDGSARLLFMGVSAIRAANR